LKLVKQGTGVLKGVDFLRDKGADLIRQTLPARESSILLGMLLGTRDGIDEEQYEDFQKTGIVHLFSVSGLHVAFLLLLITWLTSLMRMSARGRFFTAAAILLLYGTMIAWPECVIRAVLMGILGLLAYYSGRENSLLNALAISGLVILIINPNAIFLISFQLTMLATWGLVYLFPVLRDHFPYQGKLWDLLLIPVAAELAVLPLIAYHFNMFAPVSIITNILVSYLSGVAVVCGFISLLLAPAIPAGAAIFLYPAGLCVEIILYIVELMKTVPGGFIWVAAPGVILTALYYAALLMGCRGLKRAGAVGE
jgi:competence protein ComEC